MGATNFLHFSYLDVITVNILLSILPLGDEWQHDYGYGHAFHKGGSVDNFREGFTTFIATFIEIRLFMVKAYTNVRRY